MKSHSIRWMRLARMVALWFIFYIFSNFGFFWFPEKGLCIGTYLITKTILMHSLFILVCAKSINMILRTFIWDYFVSRMLNGATPYLLIQISSLIIYFISILIIIGTVFGESVIGFLTTFGAIGVVIGFGVQRLVLDAFSGVSINIDSPFSLGDYISVSTGKDNFNGIVKGISWRLTTIETDEGYMITLPNAVITGNPVRNFSRPTPTSEFQQMYYFPTHYEENEINKTLMNAALSVAAEGYIQDNPKIRFSVLEPGRLGFKIKYYVNPLVNGGPGKVRSFLHSAVMKHIKYANIEFHNPTIRTLVQKENNVKKENKTIDILKKTSVFACLSNEELKILHNTIEEEEYTKNFNIVEENEKDDASMYIITEGFAKVLIFDKKNEKNIQVATLNPGDFFGEMSLLTGESRKATVTSGINLKILKIKKNSLAPIVSQNPALYKLFAEIIATRKLSNEKNINDSHEMANRKKSLVEIYLKSIKDFFLK